MNLFYPTQMRDGNPCLGKTLGGGVAPLEWENWKAFVHLWNTIHSTLDLTHY